MNARDCLHVDDNNAVVDVSHCAFVAPNEPQIKTRVCAFGNYTQFVPPSVGTTRGLGIVRVVRFGVVVFCNIFMAVSFFERHLGFLEDFSEVFC